MVASTAEVIAAEIGHSQIPQQHPAERFDRDLYPPYFPMRSGRFAFPVARNVEAFCDPAREMSWARRPQ